MEALGGGFTRGLDRPGYVSAFNEVLGKPPFGFPPPAPGRGRHLARFVPPSTPSRGGTQVLPPLKKLGFEAGGGSRFYQTRRAKPRGYQGDEGTIGPRTNPVTAGKF